MSDLLRFVTEIPLDQQDLIISTMFKLTEHIGNLVVFIKIAMTSLGPTDGCIVSNYNALKIIFQKISTLTEMAQNEPMFAQFVAQKMPQIDEVTRVNFKKCLVDLKCCLDMLVPVFLKLKNSACFSIQEILKQLMEVAIPAFHKDFCNLDTQVAMSCENEQ